MVQDRRVAGRQARPQSGNTNPWIDPLPTSGVAEFIETPRPHPAALDILRETLQNLVEQFWRHFVRPATILPAVGHPLRQPKPFGGNPVLLVARYGKPVALQRQFR